MSNRFKQSLNDEVSVAELHQSHEAVCGGTSLEGLQPASGHLRNPSEVPGFSVAIKVRPCCGSRGWISHYNTKEVDGDCCVKNRAVGDFTQQCSLLLDAKNFRRCTMFSRQRFRFLILHKTQFFFLRMHKYHQQNNVNIYTKKKINAKCKDFDMLTFCK